MKNYIRLRKRIMDALQNDLPTSLYYHDLDHILDVLKICNQYIKREKITGRNAKLLRLAALFHDIGYTITREEHEKEGVLISKKWMTEFDFSDRDIKVIKGLIMATRVPQKPKNHLEEILCDADLDYLGRSDFYSISNKLFKELNSNGTISKESWPRIQIDFLKKHNYHTDFAIKHRKLMKERRILELSKMMKN